MAEKDPNYPAMKWNPETGEATVFNSAVEVPDGYLDTHPEKYAQIKEAELAASVKETTLPMTKPEIIAALKAGDIPFKPQQGAKALYDLLDTALRAHLAAENVTVPEGANVPALLALANPPNKTE